jgi:imidazoleglycerol phosphate synthase glutamine amidotransferase subunit HisH
LRTADYNGVRVCAAFRRGRTFGCQFHPEKNGVNGLKILRASVETSS